MTSWSQLLINKTHLPPVKAKWVIARYSISDGLLDLANAVEQTGRVTQVISSCDVHHQLLGNISKEDSCTVVYGSTITTKNIARVRPFWIPGCWHDPNFFKCSNYYTLFGHNLTQHDYIFMPLGEFLRLSEKIYERLAILEKVFVRPDQGEKIFSGELLKFQDIPGWYDMLRSAGVPVNTMCVISRPVHIDAEYRFVLRVDPNPNIFGHTIKIIDGSSYIINGEIVTTRVSPDDLKKFESFIGQTFSTVKGLPPVFIADIAVQDTKLSVLEIGSVNCSCYYACDLPTVVEAVSRSAEESYQDYKLDLLA